MQLQKFFDTTMLTINYLPNCPSMINEFSLALNYLFQILRDTRPANQKLLIMSKMFIFSNTLYHLAFSPVQTVFFLLTKLLLTLKSPTSL